MTDLTDDQINERLGELLNIYMPYTSAMVVMGLIERFEMAVVPPVEHDLGWEADPWLGNAVDCCASAYTLPRAVALAAIRCMEQRK